MLDVEYLLDPAPLDRPIIYRHRSKLLLPEVRKTVMAVADAACCITKSEVTPDEFVGAFYSNPLYPTALICDLGRSGTRLRLRDRVLACLANPYEVRALVLVPDRLNLTTRPGWASAAAQCLVIEEPMVTLASIGPALRYFARTSDLADGDVLLAQEAFVRSFDGLAQEADATLVDLRQEFLERVLTQVDAQTSLFQPNLYRKDEARRAGLLPVAAPLSAFVQTKSTHELVSLVRALDHQRWQRRTTGNQIVADLYRRSASLLRRADGKKTGRRRQAKRRRAV